MGELFWAGLLMEATTTSTATSTVPPTPVGEGNDKLTVMKPTLVCSDCLGVTTAVTAAGGGNARLQERMKLVSGSLAWKISWEEGATVAVTVDTTRAILATAIPVTATPAITTPATATSSSRVGASATTS